MANNMTFKLSPDFHSKWQGRFSRAQQFVDTKTLELSTPLVPHRTGTLINSGQRGTVIGSGEVRWTEPYARSQYYNPGYRHSENQRGAFWFERMKAVHGTQIVNGAKKILGGK